jgi:beta-galactosidase
MHLGVAYYPEQWPEARWAVDARLMADMGLAYARLGEFTWALLEPAEGRFEFEWLARAVETLHTAGLNVILGTPTAAPPPWLTSRYDIFQREANRTTVRGPGSRRHACANNPYFRQAADRIVTALAERFGQQPAVVGWQVDNEIGCHGTGHCFCDHCWAAFQRWLEGKYKTLDHLNQAWGTVFWGAVYTDWRQIPLPWTAPAQHNPSLRLDFYRFSTDSWVTFLRAQAKLLRQLAPSRFVTHNVLNSTDGGADQINYFDLSAGLDFVSWDNYPQGSSGPQHVAFNHDQVRGYQGCGYWVMEQQPGPVNWDRYNRPVPPGLVRLWSYQGLGHGAEAVLYFRWRAARAGQEQYHAGLLRQDGTPTRAYDEARQVVQELRRLPAFRRQAARVAILFDFEDWWTIQLDPHQGDFSYLNVGLSLYQDLWAAGLPVDIIGRGQSLDGYQVVLAPCPILIDATEAERWQQFVAAGGRLLVTFRAFVKDKHNLWSDQPLPAGLEVLLGVQVEEVLGLPPDYRGAARNVNGSLAFPYWKWAEVLAPTTAEPLLFYNQFYWRDRAAVTLNRVGPGLAIYAGCWFEHMLPRPVWEALGLTELALPFEVPEAVEAIPIEFDDGEGLLLLNHNAEPVTLTLDRPAAELLLDLPPMRVITLPPRAVAALKY